MFIGFHVFNGGKTSFNTTIIKKLSTYWGKAATIMNGDRMGIKG